jgi:hypothetical protein
MNRGSDSVLSVYSDARTEYTKQLCVFLVPAYFQFFIDLLERSKRDMINEPKRALWQFQNYLNEIHDWNMEKVNNEINRIQTNCGCDYLDDLLTAVFIAHTKVLTAIRLSSNKKKIEINVPKVEHFLFKVLCETSKLLWGSTYLFRDGIPGIEKQQNYRIIEQILNEGILQAVRSLVPVKSILKDFVGGDSIADAEDDDDSDNERDEKEEKDEKDEFKDTLKTTITEETPTYNNELISNTSTGITDNTQQETTNNTESILTVPPEAVTLEGNTSTTEESSNKMDVSQPPQPQTIIIEDKPTVRFGEFDAVFDSDNPMESDMIFEPKDQDEEEVPALEILDETGMPLSEGIDFDDLDENKNTSDGIEDGDYEVLS